VKWSAAVTGEIPAGFVTRISTVPDPAGVMNVNFWALTKLTFVAAALPTVTVAPGTKLLPVAVTKVPPPEDPEVGLRPEIDGGPW